MRKTMLKGVILSLAILLMYVSPVAAAATVTWRVAGSEFIYDADGSTKLVAGDYVQLWDVTNDTLLAEAAIGDGLMPAGQFSAVKNDLAPGNYTVNIRVYNAAKAVANGAGACSGISSEQEISVEATGFKTIDFTGFSTLTCPSDPTAVEMSALAASSGWLILTGLALAAGSGALLWKRKNA